MTRRKQRRAPKKSSASRTTKFVAHGDLLSRNYRIPVKVALHADDWCIGLFQVTPLSAFGVSSFWQALSRHDVVALYIAGCNINARVATKGDNGTIWIYAEEVLRGLAKPVFVAEDLAERGTRDAKRKMVRRNG
jgi:hypothetical protein